MATKRTKAQKEEGISLAEFRAWLSGIEEMQGPDWAPNVEQWTRIKAKFADIREEVIVEQAPVQSRPPGVYPPNARPMPQQPQQLMQPQQESSLAPQRTMPAPPMPLPPNLQQTNKTPDIDSSKGYESSFV